ncbi:zinc metalloprotease [Paraflavitalea speifideaquila]|uniref:zinc metalloprotease n=1 Tax=Paraflavitalea speifideaquila TaxID=3076558 RepID=UPI0028E33FDC|nr:zinc metalloprotease [Paraflavitalea speifideiaquila]
MQRRGHLLVIICFYTFVKMPQNNCLRFYQVALPFLLALAIGSCRKPGHDPDPEPPPITSIPDDEIVRIPVVVHVLYSNAAFNISDQKIQTQLTVLNEDFRKKNADVSKTPAEFTDRVADVGIEFVLATKDPRGNPTDGIIRVSTQVDGWSGNNPSGTIPVEDLDLFHTAKGGSDAWPSDRYLNIYVAGMSDRQGKLGLAGYSSYPGADARIDAVVIDPRAFGTQPPLSQGHELGRTATHETGHWFNLLHIFGNTDNCSSTDYVDDTPSTGTRYMGHPTYPQNSCGHSNMFMNFMDYVDDDAMYLFTRGQRERMRKTFFTGGGRHQLYKHCTGKSKKKMIPTWAITTAAVETISCICNAAGLE